MRRAIIAAEVGAIGAFEHAESGVRADCGPAAKLGRNAHGHRPLLLKGIGCDPRLQPGRCA